MWNPKTQMIALSSFGNGADAALHQHFTWTK
jgi:hypothetical protein